MLAPVADEEEEEEEVVEEPVPTETLCVLCREAKLGKQGCAALLETRGAPRRRDGDRHSRCEDRGRARGLVGVGPVSRRATVEN